VVLVVVAQVTCQALQLLELLIQAVEGVAVDLTVRQHGKQAVRAVAVL
jgi:hypothetical protein